VVLSAWLFVTAGMGLLLVLDQTRPVPLWDNSRGAVPRILPKLGREAAEILIQSAFLIALYYLAFEFWMAEGDEPLHALFFLPAALAVNAVRKKGEMLPLVVFAVCCLTASSASPGLPALLSAAGMVSGIFVFQFLITGLREKALLSTVPGPLEGLPILFLTASLAALALCGLRGFLP